MVKKIISGGQTGADQAALDVAIKLGIPHGGWIPKGRLTENGPLEAKYQLQEMETANYNKRTEQNVIDSHGTLIISHGMLTGGSEYTREMATYHNRPWLHIDLNTTSDFHAAQKIQSWIKDHHIETLNVAGPRASKDAQIYRATTDILETVLYLDLVESSLPNPSEFADLARAVSNDADRPSTVEAAVEKLLAKLSLREKTMIANIPKKNLNDLYHALEADIQSEFSLWLANDELLEACRVVSGKKDLNEDDAALVIIQTLWNRLQQTNVLRIIK